MGLLILNTANMANCAAFFEKLQRKCCIFFQIDIADGQNNQNSRTT